MGLIDGDGCFYISKDKKVKHFSITSTITQDWKYMINLFETLNIKKYLISKKVNKKGKSSSVRIANYNDNLKLHNYIYPNGFEMGLRRKYKKSKSIVDNKPKYTLNNSDISKSELINKIYELKNIKEVSKYFGCSRKKIYNACKKYNIRKDGFIQVKRLKKEEYMNFLESKEYIQKFNIKSKKEWINFSKSNNRPKSLPSNPYTFYKGNGWKSYGDWLGFDKYKYK